MSFTTGTATFTSGSTVVSGVALTNGTLTGFTRGTRVEVGSNPVIKITAATKYLTATSFELDEAWPLASGTYEFTASMTSEGLWSAVQQIRTYIARIQGESAALAKLYDNIAEGLAGTNNGDYFNVISSDPYIYSNLYLNNLGLEELVASMPTKLAIDEAIADALASQQAAALSEANALASANNAAISESNAGLSESNAAVSESNASTSASNALLSEQNAGISESNASASASSALLSEQMAAASETNAATSATNAATSEANAAASASNAATSETNAAVSETNAAASSLAAQQAQAATEQLFDQFGDQYLGAKPSDPTTDNDGGALNAGDIYWNTTDNVLKFYSGTAWTAPEDIATTAAANAATSEQNAATSAANAAVSETNAATSEANALSSAQAAVVSETNAATSEQNAATSEANAAASATNALASEQAAAQSATEAQGSYDEFLKRYYGTYASDPTTDPLGNPLSEGDLYFNTTDKTLYLYNGTNWQRASTVVEGVYDVSEYTNVQGQTTFTLPYDVGLVQVLYNGVQLAQSDFTATDNATIVLATAVTEVDDIVTIIRWGAVTESSVIVEAPTAGSAVKRTATGAVRAADGVNADEVLTVGQSTEEATASKLVKRTATGAVRAAEALNADEAVVLGQTGTAYSRDVGTAAGNVVGVDNLPDDVADMYARNNILGTVSQSGGTPTGAIIERGSNANGEYVKYADGTLEMFGLVNDGRALDLAYGGLYRTTSANITLPAALSDSHPAHATIHWFDASGYAGWGIYTNLGVNNISSTILLSAQTVPASTKQVVFRVIGRWY